MLAFINSTNVYLESIWVLRHNFRESLLKRYLKSCGETSSKQASMVPSDKGCGRCKHRDTRRYEKGSNLIGGFAKC